MAQMFKRENFDESKLHPQDFPCQYFAIEQKNLSTSILVLFMAYMRVRTE